MILLDLVNATSAENGTLATETVTPRTRATTSRTIEDRLSAASDEVKDRFESLKAYLLALGDDVQAKTLKHYFAFRRLRNFACVEVHPQNGLIVLYLKVDPELVELQQGFTRDVRQIGHYGTGDLEVTIRSDEELEKAKPLILRSYESA